MKKSLSHITHNKNVIGSNLLLCTYYGRDHHLKTNCLALKDFEDCLAGYFEHREEVKDLVLG